MGKFKHLAIVVVIIFLVVGGIVAPRPSSHVLAEEIIDEALIANSQNPDAQIDYIKQELSENAAPVLHGQSSIAGRPTWVMRLKPSHKKYPWIQLWIDKKNSEIVAWKIWERRGKCASLADRFSR